MNLVICSFPGEPMPFEVVDEEADDAVLATFLTRDDAELFVDAK